MTSTQASRHVPMPFTLPTLLILGVGVNFSSVGSAPSAFTVEVDVDRLLKELLSGPKWVSLNPVTREHWSNQAPREDD